MSVQFQDYYETLGVDRKATKEEIQREYRKLARKYHPDVNKDPGAEDRFKDINEAYEVLSDPEKRGRYDALGANWQAGQDFQPPPNWDELFGFPGGGRVRFESGPEGFSGFSDFFEMLFGDIGAHPGFNPSGGVSSGHRGRSHEAEISITLEDAFHGAAKSITLERATPDTSGSMQRDRKTYQVKIPPGTVHGSTIRLAGQGSPGVGGGKPGDLLLRVKVLPHSRFKVKGHDLHLTVPISPWEAALGSKVSVQGMDGELTVTIPAGSQSGQSLRLKDKGLPRREGTKGSLYLELKITVPKNLSARERELFEHLKADSSFEPRGN